VKVQLFYEARHRLLRLSEQMKGGMQQLQPRQMHWVRADSSDFGGDRPAARRYSALHAAVFSIRIPPY
jgi:hypothetical protein